MRSYYGLVPFLLALPVFAAQYETQLPGATIAAIASDRHGAVYVTGSTASPSLPTTATSIQRVWNGGTCGHLAPSGDPIPCTDAFVAKFSGDGTLVWATYLGGSGNDRGTAITVDSTGNAIYVAGTTTSSNFPNSGDVVQATNKGPIATGSASAQTAPADGDVFVVKISATGDALQRATFLGGSGADVPRRLIADGYSNVYVAGSTKSNDFPAINSTFTPLTESFIAKMDVSLRTLAISMCLEADIADIAVAPDASIYATGWSKSLLTTLGAYQTSTGSAGDAFVVRVRTDGSDLMFATYLGNRTNGRGLAIVTDQPAGVPWVLIRGPVTGAAEENGYNLVRLDPTGARLYSTDHIGADGAGTSADDWSLRLDYQNKIWLAGALSPESFILTDNAAQRGACSSEAAAFFRRYSSSGAIEYSGYAPAAVAGFAVDANSRMYYARGSAVGQVLLTTDGATMQAFCAVNSASFRPAGISPGEAFTVFGISMGPSQGSPWHTDLQGKVSTYLAGVRVLVNDVAVPLLYAQSQQINAVAPNNLVPGSDVSIVVEYNGVRSAPLSLKAVATSPGIFIADTKPFGQGAIQNEDYKMNARNNAARYNTFIAFWVTGMGVTTPASVDGVLTPVTELPQFAAPVTVRLGGIESFVGYAGAAPLLCAGVGQMNVKIPSGFPSGTDLSAVPISIQIGDETPRVLATVAVRP